jgi:hypothetical protein
MNANDRLRIALASLLALVTILAAAPLPSAWAADTGWWGEYYANRWLGGAPAVTRTDASIDFDWGNGSPAPAIPADQFSARWTRVASFDGGRYRFTVRVDDGARLFVDGALVIDAWKDEPPTTYTVERDLAPGDHALRLEYYENAGGASVRLWWDRVDIPSPPANAWLGEYYANRWLSGALAVTRYDANIDFDWGSSSPDPRLPADHFSTRWTRTARVEGGRYRFTAAADDGVRLYVDGALVIDAWRDQALTTYTVERDLAPGDHALRLEYYENAGGAAVRLQWQRVAASETPPTASWRGEYFADRSLSGQPALVRDDPSIAFNWGSASPGPAIPADNFSVRWTRNMQFGGGHYRFSTVTDDGVRLYVDGNLVLDFWRDMNRETHSVELALSRGAHTVRMEYYEAYGGAYARLTIQRLDDVSREQAVGNIITCARPRNSWIKVYRLDGDRWTDVNPQGFGPVSGSGYVKIDGLPVDQSRYGNAGHPYRVELWANRVLIRSVGNTSRGEPEFRVRAGMDSRTPWGCPAP